MGCGSSSAGVPKGPLTPEPFVEKDIEIHDVNVLEENDKENRTVDDDEEKEEHEEAAQVDPHENDNNGGVTEIEDDVCQIVSDEEGSETPSPEPEVPPVQPPTTLKKDVFNPKDFQQVDDRARSVDQTLRYGSMEDLVRHLTEGCTSDMAKLRSLFSWLTSIDIPSLEHILDTLPDPHTPLDYLLKLHWRLTNYAYFFAQLCWLAGLPCYVVDGINKSAAYEVGDVIEPTRLAAQWNGVLVDGQWRILDVFWASTCVVGRQSRDWSLMEEDDDVTSVTSKEEDEEGHAQHVVNEFFFIPDPEHVGWTHLPNDTRWQLTDNNISFEEFQNRVYVRERFFELGMTLPEDQKECTVDASNGEVTLTFGVPPTESDNFQFRYLLYKQRVITNDDQEFARLDQFVYFTKATDHVLYQARFPVQGLFRLDVYGRDMREHETFDLVCSYVIRCSSPKPQCQPLPDNPEIGWGPGVETKKAGLTPVSHEDGNIFTDDGIVQIRFENGNATSILQNLRNNDLDEWLLRRHAVVHKDDKEIVIDIRLPSAGEYALNLFGNSGETDELPDNICNYLIHCTNTSNNEPFPRLHEGVLGSGEAAEALGIQSEEDQQYIIKTDGDAKSITFKHSADVELFCELHHTDNNRFAMADKVTRITGDGTTTFNIEVGVAGLYGVNVYAKDKYSNDSGLYHVHTYLIDNNSDSLRSLDIADDEGLEVELFELVTNTKHTSVNIPTYDKESVQLVAQLRQRFSNGVNDPEHLKARSTDKGYTFDVTVPEVGDYTLDIYQALETGALVHKVTYLIYREEGPVEDNNEDDDDAQELDIKDGEAEVLNQSMARMDSVTPGHMVKKEPEIYQEKIRNPEEEARLQKQRVKEEKQRLLRKHLKDALRSRDEAAILKTLKNLKDAGVPEDIHEIKKAYKFLVYLSFSHSLQSAMATRDLKTLEKLVQEVIDAKLEKRMGLQLAMARRIIGQLNRINELRHDILSLDQTTIAELKSYANPPHQVHVVMTGTLVLLGEPETRIKHWKSVQAMINKTGKCSLKRRVSDFCAGDVRMNTARAAKRILSRYDVDEVRDVSAGAATFFVWHLLNLKAAVDMTQSPTQTSNEVP